MFRGRKSPKESFKKGSLDLEHYANVVYSVYEIEGGKVFFLS